MILKVAYCKFCHVLPVLRLSVLMVRGPLLTWSLAISASTHATWQTGMVQLKNVLTMDFVLCNFLKYCIS